MTPPAYRVRRANLDDLASLKGLWESMRLPAETLEKRLTEFQIVESWTGQIFGALGIQIQGHHAALHSEGYTDFGVADEVRPLLFERIRTLAANHGVFRLWMQDRSPFWIQEGFKPASPDTLQRLPEQWRNNDQPHWLTLQLKDEDALLSLEKEFAVFKQAELARTTGTLRKARFLRILITVVGFTIGLILIGLAGYIFIRRQRGG